QRDCFRNIGYAVTARRNGMLAGADDPTRTSATAVAGMDLPGAHLAGLGSPRLALRLGWSGGDRGNARDRAVGGRRGLVRGTQGRRSSNPGDEHVKQRVPLPRELDWLLPGTVLTAASAAFALIESPNYAGILPALELLPLWMLAAAAMAG